MSVPSAVPSLLGGPVRGVGATMARWGGRAPDFVPHNMVRFLIRRLGFVALTLVLASVIVFVAMQVRGRRLGCFPQYSFPGAGSGVGPAGQLRHVGSGEFRLLCAAGHILGGDRRSEASLMAGPGDLNHITGLHRPA